MELFKLTVVSRPFLQLFWGFHQHYEFFFLTSCHSKTSACNATLVRLSRLSKYLFSSKHGEIFRFGWHRYLLLQILTTRYHHPSSNEELNYPQLSLLVRPPLEAPLHVVLPKDLDGDVEVDGVGEDDDRGEDQTNDDSKTEEEWNRTENILPCLYMSKTIQYT